MPKHLNLRKRALQAGMRIYVGNPCGRCGETLRYASNGGCTACQEASRVRYMQRVIVSQRGANESETQVTAPKTSEG